MKNILTYIFLISAVLLLLYFWIIEPILEHGLFKTIFNIVAVLVGLIIVGIIKESK